MILDFSVITVIHPERLLAALGLSSTTSTTVAAHTHPEYSPTTHAHPQYALATHTHPAPDPDPTLLDRLLTNDRGEVLVHAATGNLLWAS